MKLDVNKIDDNSSFVDIEADGEEQVIFILAPTIAQIQDMAARRGFYSRIHKSFGPAAKQILDQFAAAGIPNSDADAIIEGFLTEEEDEIIAHRIVER